MIYEVQSENFSIPTKRPLVEYRNRRDLQREMELLLDDEGITAGLDDSAAEIIIAWAEAQIEAAYHQPNWFSEVATAIRSHARSVGKVAAMIADGEDTERIQRLLRFRIRRSRLTARRLQRCLRRRCLSRMPSLTRSAVPAVRSTSWRSRSPSTRFVTRC